MASVFFVNKCIYSIMVFCYSLGFICVFHFSCVIITQCLLDRGIRPGITDIHFFFFSFFFDDIHFTLAKNDGS